VVAGLPNVRSVDDHVGAIPRGGQTDDFRPLPYTLGGGGHGVQGQICDILTQASYESLPAPWPHRFPHFGYIHLGGAGGGALILD
jgi:hypothetical protein